MISSIQHGFIRHDPNTLFNELGGFFANLARLKFYESISALNQIIFLIKTTINEKLHRRCSFVLYVMGILYFHETC